MFTAIGNTRWQFLADIVVTNVISTQQERIFITGGHPHVMEEVYGLGVVVGASRWTLSSWFEPPNAQFVAIVVQW